MPKLPKWFLPIIVAVGVAVAMAYVFTGSEREIEVSESDRSMRPIIGKKARFKVNAAWLARPTRNTVVAFHPPGGAPRPAVATVVALPGDKIEVREHRLYVNGAVTKSDVRSMPRKTVPEFKCPHDCVYVLVASAQGKVKDSVEFGPLPLWRVLGSLRL